jgi:hypothetical protein
MGMKFIKTSDKFDAEIKINRKRELGYEIRDIKDNGFWVIEPVFLQSALHEFNDAFPVSEEEIEAHKYLTNEIKEEIHEIRLEMALRLFMCKPDSPYKR